MSRFLLIIATFSILAAACSATRKISSVGVRELSSAEKAQVVSNLRLRLADTKKIAKQCPAELAHLLPNLALEDVIFPGCPAELAENFHAALPLLKPEERTAVEEAINSQCRSLGSNLDGTSMDVIFTSSVLGNLAARYPEETPESRALAGTRDGLSFLISHHLPLDRWVKTSSSYLLSEEVIAALEKMVVTRKCKLSDSDMDGSFHTIRLLEDLARILIDGEQREKITKLLVAIYAVQDRKIEEFFRP